eukprot:6015239-Pyramimonas_sp.AAC.1
MRPARPPKGPPPKKLAATSSVGRPRDYRDSSTPAPKCCQHGRRGSQGCSQARRGPSMAQTRGLLIAWDLL